MDNFKIILLTFQYIIKKDFFQFVSILITFMSVAILVSTMVYNVKKLNFDDPSDMTNIFISRMIKGNKVVIEKEDILQVLPELQSNNTISLNIKFNALKKEVDSIKAETLALKEMTIPLSPEQIITVARLTDIAIQNKKDVNKIERELEKKLLNYENKINEDLSFNRQLNWCIIAALVSLFASVVYNTYKQAGLSKKA